MIFPHGRQSTTAPASEDAEQDGQHEDELAEVEIVESVMPVPVARRHGGPEGPAEEEVVVVVAAS